MINKFLSLTRFQVTIEKQIIKKALTFLSSHGNASVLNDDSVTETHSSLIA